MLLALASSLYPLPLLPISPSLYLISLFSSFFPLFRELTSAGRVNAVRIV